MGNGLLNPRRSTARYWPFQSHSEWIVTHGTDTDDTGTPDGIASRPSLRSDTEGGPAPAGAALRFRHPAGAGHSHRRAAAASRTGRAQPEPERTRQWWPGRAKRPPGQPQRPPASVPLVLAPCERSGSVEAHTAAGAGSSARLIPRTAHARTDAKPRASRRPVAR